VRLLHARLRDEQFAEFYRRGRTSRSQASKETCCCTGYRLIDAGRSPRWSTHRATRTAQRLDAPPKMHAVRHEHGSRRFFRPSTLAEAMEILAAHPDAKIVSGGTDLVVEINQRHARFETILSLEAIDELRTIDDRDDALVIGASVSLSEIEHGVPSAPAMLRELLPLFSSRLIRNRATLGGNLVTASPIGDSPPVLLALGAEVEIAGKNGKRMIALDQFFLGYRKTAMTAGEILARVRIPKPYPRIQRFFKVSKRRHDDISTVAAAFAIDLDGSGTITKARLAYGGVAATPVRALDAERAIEGKRWSAAIANDARAHLEHAFTPMTDQRGSSEYRRAMVTRLFEKLCAENGGEP
jgi:xanthine dehydrogenase small subunit